jgi:Peptidase A4 family
VSRIRPLRWIVGVCALGFLNISSSAGLQPIPNTGQLSFADRSSSSWAGYEQSGAGFSKVSATWTQPAVTCSPGIQAAAIWVGFDGDLSSGTSSTVEQIGSGVACVNSQPIYVAFYEFYPRPSVTLNKRRYPVIPGDVLTATVTGNGTIFTMDLVNVRHGKRLWRYHVFPTRFRNASRLSAEWIVEAPTLCTATCAVVPLADIGTVHFSGAVAKTAPPNRAGAKPATDSISLLQDAIGANPSALSVDGTSFDVTVSRHP